MLIELRNIFNSNIYSIAPHELTLCLVDFCSCALCNQSRECVIASWNDDSGVFTLVLIILVVR